MSNSTAKVVNDYRFVVSGTEYSAPEIRSFHLQGIAEWIPKGSPRHMTSSPVVSFVDGIVITRSGTQYVLGTPADGFPSFGELLEKHPGVRLG